jgi:hypothetical protein
MTPIRKDALRRLIYICLGVLLILPFANTTGPARFIGIIGFLVALYQVIRILIISQSLLNDFFPVKKDKEDDDALPNKVIYGTAMVVFVGGLIGLISQITPLENTIKGGRLFLFSAVAGLFIGVGFIFILKAKFPSLLNDSGRRVSVIFGFALGFFFLVPAIINLVNTGFEATGIDCVALPTESKFIAGTNDPSYHVNLNIQGDDERFEVSKETYDSVSAGDSLNLCVKHGFIGYDFVDGLPTIFHR